MSGNCTHNSVTWWILTGYWIYAMAFPPRLMLLGYIRCVYSIAVKIRQVTVSCITCFPLFLSCHCCVLSLSSHSLCSCCPSYIVFSLSSCPPLSHCSLIALPSILLSCPCCHIVHSLSCCSLCLWSCHLCPLIALSRCLQFFISFLCFHLTSVKTV